MNKKTELLKKVEFHSFHWDNYNQDILNAHKKVMKHFGLKVQYTQENIPHGEWLDRTMRNATSEVIAIIEPDLIPTNLEIVLDSIEFALKNDTFVGTAQVSSHLGTASHIFAAPSFFIITKSCYDRLGRPSFLEIPHRCDVGENLSYVAEEMGITFRTLMPQHYERFPIEGAWRFGSYGYCGVGTLYAGGIYHLFQGRYEENVKLFLKRCEQILSGKKITTRGFKRCDDFELPEQIFNPLRLITKNPAGLERFQQLTSLQAFDAELTDDGLILHYQFENLSNVAIKNVEFVDYIVVNRQVLNAINVFVDFANSLPAQSRTTIKRIVSKTEIPAPLFEMITLGIKEMRHIFHPKGLTLLSNEIILI